MRSTTTGHKFDVVSRSHVTRVLRRRWQPARASKDATNWSKETGLHLGEIVTRFRLCRDGASYVGRCGLCMRGNLRVLILPDCLGTGCCCTDPGLRELSAWRVFGRPVVPLRSAKEVR
jgi:hypothetical protein